MINPENGNLYMYSGKIGFPSGAPSLLDIAISLSREGRYAGAGMRWWPVALHTFVVCDLLPANLKIHGLIHDSTECVTGDVPKPSKSTEVEFLEEELLKVIYKSLGITEPTATEKALVKEADKKALRGEVYTVGTQALQQVYDRCPEAEDLVYIYLDKYTYADCLEASGRVPIEFMRRFRKYKDLL
jgi:5'-deoxynucleotidase YfbR-like HD superfamily hydrolase